MTTQVDTHYCGLAIIQSRVPLKPPGQCGGSDDRCRATLFDLSDLTSMSPRPYNQPRRVEGYGPLWWLGLVCLVMPWLAGVGVLGRAGLRLLLGD